MTDNDNANSKGAVSGWTIDTLAAHHDTIRHMQDRFDVERDRRYTEVGVEREKALKIKETADLAALGLAREIQTYKDEKANELREQINSERGLYASKSDLVALGEKLDAQLKPIESYILGAQGRGAGMTENRAVIAWAVALIASLIAIGTFVFRAPPPAVQSPQIIYVPTQPPPTTQAR